MTIVKQGVDISFANGLDTKTDAKRVPMGTFVSLQNSVFTNQGLLQKRNGYGQLASLPDTSYSYLTTLNDNLTAVGSNIGAYVNGTSQWTQKGTIAPLSVSVLPLIRNNFNQTSCDSIVSSTGLVCTAYIEYNGSSYINKYVVADSTTGQNVVEPTVVPVGTGAVSGGMRTFILGNNFVIVFTNYISSVYHLQYMTISIANPTIVSTPADLAPSYVPAATLSWDGYVAGNYLYVAYNTTSGGQSVHVRTLSSGLVLATAVSLAGAIGTMFTVTADTTQTLPVIYVTYYDASGTTGYTAVFDYELNLISNPIQIIPSGTYLNLASAAQNGYCQIFAELSNVYSFDSDIPTNLIESITVTPLIHTTHSHFSSGASSITVASASGLVTGMTVVDNTTKANIPAATTITVSGTSLALSNNTAGNSAASPGDVLAFSTLTTPVVTIRSCGIGSKAFIIDGVIYLLGAYYSLYQSTYFLLNGASLESAPMVIAKLAYENGGGYYTTGLPGVTVTGTTAQIPYLYKDLIQAANKNTNVVAGTQVAGIYAQTGIQLASFEIGTQGLDSVEIASALHMTGGFLWMYDGYLPVEHNFFLWSDDFSVSWSATGGSMAAKPDGSTNTDAYYYQITYEWADNNGNIYRSAPSIPEAVTTTGSLSTGSVTLNIPTLRLTYKTANPVKIVIYRWSVAQQIYYQVTSVTQPLLNDTTVDSVEFIDTLADASILGNNIIYTNGGVVEDINAPASNLITLFDTRLWLVDAEDPNLLYYSKQVIENTPVEMSDLFTLYIAPTTGAEGSTGPITAIFPMDDKVVIFKQNAIYYINGSGPDNTGANSGYSQPIFVTATVGCANQKSIVLTPQGLMFQSNKGIWLLGRDLNTSYIGAPVEKFNAGIVNSAQNIPETNQIRFTLSTGITLMYDYYYAQWGTFVGVPAISSCIHNGLHTFIDQYARTFQETPGSYIDGSSPVLMQFQTGPLRLGDLQNYQRSFFFYLLGDYYSPHKLMTSIAYDYDINPSQSVLLVPANYSPAYGTGASQTPYGQQVTYGGPKQLEHYRVFLERQRCMAFSITVQEVYDGTYQVPAGAGFTLSGINLVMGFKNKFPTIASSLTFG